MASAPRNHLSFTCVWTQKPGDDVHEFVAAYKRFFEWRRGQTVRLQTPRKILRHEWEDQKWLVQISLDLHSRMNVDKIESMSTEIARQWCTTGLCDKQMSRYLQWLQPDRKNGFWHGWYAIEEGIKMNSIAFGTFVGLDIFAERHAIVGNCTGNGYNIDCTFRHDERSLQVFIELKHCLTTDVYRLSMPYSNIFNVIVHDPDSGSADVFLQVHTLPLFHRAAGTRGSFVSRYAAQESSSRDELNFQRTLKIGCNRCGRLLESSDVGGCFVIRLSFKDRHEARRTVGRLSRRCKRARFSFVPVKTLVVGSRAEELRQELCSRIMPKLQFGCCYALNSLIQMSDDIVVQLMVLEKHERDTLFKDLERYAAHNEGALEEALFSICTALGYKGNVTFAAVLPELFKKFCKTYVPTAVPQGSCLVRRLFVTPSHVFFLPPAVHAENRVLRKFDADYALRVSFRDDHFELLSHSLGSHGDKRDMLDEVVGRFLRNGIKISDRHYRLLASSVSQLRDHGVWLYANDCHGNSVESIRAWMGDFSEIPSVAKKIARMGQCFSTTEESVIVPLHGETMEDAPDIEGGVHPLSRKPYVFSDGIGMISESLMKKVCAKLDMAQVPSAIQIRYAGYKGMLCTNNALEGDKLILRKSMNKFACVTSASIEVIKVSAPSTVFLNRPLITILEQLGVPRRVFLHLHQKMLVQLCDALINDGTALRVLGTYANTSLPFAKLLVNGISLSREPLTRAIILAVYESLLVGLKEKSRIAIPPEKGRNMLGVLDETSTLEYGQVFVQYTHLGIDFQDGTPDSGNNNAGSTQVLTGTVLVTKCPCLHPGDVRKFEAVDVPALHHIRDCIVFPAKGPRPHPNEMAGSDLDGDEYIVIWEPDLFFPGSNREPMVFSDTSVGAPSSGNLDDDIIGFLCKYILNDNVGVMSNAHLAWADNCGIFSGTCLNLAKKISTCLDFAKTGINAELDPSERVLKYPDFMNKRGIKPVYRSTRVLGELYRLNKTLIGNTYHAFTAADFHGALFDYPGWQKHQCAAENARDIYEDMMKRIMNQYGIESEAEVVAGVINSVSRYNKSKQDRTSVETLVSKQYQELIEVMQKQFAVDVEAASQRCHGQPTQQTLLEMASAWYMVICSNEQFKDHSLGLPWCIADSLLLILKERSCAQSMGKTVSRNLLSARINRQSIGRLPRDAAFDLLCEWARKEDLLCDTATKASQVCMSCFKQAFQQYMSHIHSSTGAAALSCVKSQGGDADSCGHTTADYVTGFIRYLTISLTGLPVCSECCSPSGQVHKLTLAALYRYSRLVMSRDVCCFGLPCDPDLHDSADDVLESDPIRINVETTQFLKMLREQESSVKELLCRWTGVEEVNIRLHSYRSRRHHYIIVSAVGRQWQLCCFDELVAQPWLEDAIVSKRLGYDPVPLNDLLFGEYEDFSLLDDIDTCFSDFNDMLFE